MVAFNLWGEVDYLQGGNAPECYLHEVVLVEPCFFDHEPLMFPFFWLALPLITQVPGQEEAAEIEVPFLLPHEIIDALARAGKLQVLGFGFVVADHMFILPWPLCLKKIRCKGTPKQSGTRTHTNTQNKPLKFSIRFQKLNTWKLCAPP